MVKRFRKKPVVVEAMQWRGPEDNADLVQFAQYYVSIANVVYITTREGGLKVSPGDWIVKGTAGEFYPVKPEIFKDVYDEED